MRATGAELLGALSPYRTHPTNRFGMYERRKGNRHLLDEVFA